MTDHTKAGIGAAMKGFIALSGIIALSLGLGATWYFGSPPPSKATAAADRTPRVDVINPRRAAIAQRLQSDATLAAFEEANLYAKVSGYLSQVAVDIGDRIAARQILAVVDIPELSKELAETEAQLDSRRRSDVRSSAVSSVRPLLHCSCCRHCLRLSNKAELATRPRSIRMTHTAVTLMPRHDQWRLTIDRINVPVALMSQLNSDLCRRRKIS